jgi:ethanolaminephosphotransferase
MSPGQAIFVVGTLLHLISLSSSSFIEEEHQVWYFLWLTFAVVVLYELCCALFSKKPSGPVYKSHSSLEKPKPARLLLNLIGLLFLHRILRKWNQTGDKWASLPDVGDWLIQQEHKTFLSVVLLLGNSHFLTIYSECFKHL